MNTGKNLKNYTTSIDYSKTITEIENLVVQKMKATQFFKEYKDGIIVAVVFVIPTDKGFLPFKLPARVEKVEQLFYTKKKPRYNWQKAEPLTDREKIQARNTAWRNVKDWIDAQCALIETEQVKIEEVFLPYMTTAEGKTMFELMRENDMKIPKLGTGPMEGEVID